MPYNLPQKLLQNPKSILKLLYDSVLITGLEIVHLLHQDLLIAQQRDNLGQHLEQIKTLAPILICSMKIFIQILNQQGTGTDEAIANRNYLAGRMHDEISEVNRNK